MEDVGKWVRNCHDYTQKFCLEKRSIKQKSNQSTKTFKIKYPWVWWCMLFNSSIWEQRQVDLPGVHKILWSHLPTLGFKIFLLPGFHSGFFPCVFVSLVFICLFVCLFVCLSSLAFLSRVNSFFFSTQNQNSKAQSQHEDNTENPPLLCSPDLCTWR